MVFDGFFDHGRAAYENDQTSVLGGTRFVNRFECLPPASPLVLEQRDESNAGDEEKRKENRRRDNASEFFEQIVSQIRKHREQYRAEDRNCPGCFVFTLEQRLEVPYPLIHRLCL